VVAGKSIVAAERGFLVDGKDGCVMRAGMGGDVVRKALRDEPELCSGTAGLVAMYLAPNPVSVFYTQLAQRSSKARMWLKGAMRRLGGESGMSSRWRRCDIPSFCAGWRKTVGAGAAAV
jgi:hypothetical protein